VRETKLARLVARCQDGIFRCAIRAGREFGPVVDARKIQATAAVVATAPDTECSRQTVQGSKDMTRRSGCA